MKAWFAYYLEYPNAEFPPISLYIIYEIIYWKKKIKETASLKDRIKLAWLNWIVTVNKSRNTPLEFFYGRDTITLKLYIDIYLHLFIPTLDDPANQGSTINIQRQVVAPDKAPLNAGWSCKRRPFRNQCTTFFCLWDVILCNHISESTVRDTYNK